MEGRDCDERISPWWRMLFEALFDVISVMARISECSWCGSIANDVRFLGCGGMYCMLCICYAVSRWLGVPVR